VNSLERPSDKEVDAVFVGDVLLSSGTTSTPNWRMGSV
jgi:hypothetical protein